MTRPPRDIPPMRLLTVSMTFLILFLICLVLFFSVNCSSSHLGKALNVTVAVAGVADLATTNAAIAEGRGKEGNFVMSQRAWQRALLKSAGIGVVLGGSHLLERQHKVIAAHVIRIAASAVWFAASYHNFNVGRQGR